MEVPIESIKLSFYDDRVREVSTGSPFGGKIYLQSRKEDQNAADLYWGRTEDGKYEIWLNRRNLSEPEGLVATLAHKVRKLPPPPGSHIHPQLLAAYNPQFQNFPYKIIGKCTLTLIFI
ncbi:MAG: hypothetical protein J0H74_09745 [Chitinophagaceae bacterium]|nr:hypothetical protein [Chitinophagaceae bacterium]